LRSRNGKEGICCRDGFHYVGADTLSNRIGIRQASQDRCNGHELWPQALHGAFNRCFSNVGIRDLMPGSQLVINFQRFGFADSWHTGCFHERADAVTSREGDADKDAFLGAYGRRALED